MATSNHLTPGMTIQVGKQLFRVESSVKVTVPKGSPFIKTKLRNLDNQKVSEKNFKLNQSVKEVPMTKKKLAFLYEEGKNYLFLDVGEPEQYGDLEIYPISTKIVAEKANFLKEGVETTAFFFGEKILAIELPQFLELMVAEVEGEEEEKALPNATKMAILETGARIEVPPFVEEQDMIKVDTSTKEYVQRI